MSIYFDIVEMSSDKNNTPTWAMNCARRSSDNHLNDFKCVIFPAYIYFLQPAGICLIRILASHLFGANLLSKQMLAYS